MARTKDPSAATTKAWLSRKRNMAVREREAALAGPIAYVKYLGGGVSKTYKVTLEDGSEYNFKLSERNDKGKPEHEVGAWEVAKLVGMEDMVPASTIRKIDDPGPALNPFSRSFTEHLEGSLTEWQTGEPGVNLDYDGKHGDSSHDIKRAAMFDYIIGNPDRHDGNWVVEHDKVRLIDHNRAFSLRGVSSMLGDFAVTKWPHGSIAEYVKPYAEKKSHILDALRRAGVDEVRIRSVSKNIDGAVSAAEWIDIYAG